MPPLILYDQQVATIHRLAWPLARASANLGAPTNSKSENHIDCIQRAASAA
jgi:hypothetical protein